ncbi:MAG: hypothetical protein Hens3KO_03190 [Henriciella sp.]
MRKLVFIALIGLTACSQEVPPANVEASLSEPVLQLADAETDMEAVAEKVIGSVNPLENDLQGLEIAVRLRDAFRISSSGVDFELKVTDGDGNVPIEESFDLVETSNIESATLSGAAREGFYIRTYRLDDKDRPVMQAADAILQKLKQQSTGDNELTFQAVAHSCVEPDAPEPSQYSLTIYVRSHPGVDFVTLSEEWIADRDANTVANPIFKTCED